MESISLWSQGNQNELQFYKLFPNSRKCDLAVDAICEDLTENVTTKLIGFIENQAYTRGFNALLLVNGWALRTFV